MKKFEALSFANTREEFTQVLNARVMEYFRKNKISRYANAELYVKTIVMFVIYFLPYTLVLTVGSSSILFLLGASLIMGIGLAGIGVCVMHDANHGSYSRKGWVNTMLGYSLNLIGANAFNWKVQHNVLHHSFTNIASHDEDIESRGVLRLSPHTPWKKIHRFQAIYAWFLYGLMTIVWLFFKDFTRLEYYRKMGMFQSQKTSPAKERLILIISKSVYIGYIFILPLLLSPFHWWQIVLGILLMHYVAGFLLAIIFQPAHVAEGTDFPLPDESNTLQTAWTIHQLKTTANFGSKQRVFSWFAGGLNYQIEHHLFPTISHVHYRKIAAIVKDTAHEYGLPYRSFDTFFEALRGHARLLRQLGNQPAGA